MHKLLLYVLLIFGTFTIQSQKKIITGFVSGVSGVLPGVSIIVEGSNIGSQTDFDGKYSINAKYNDVLVFQYLGYKTIKRKVGKLSIINVTLVENHSVLEEIVVVGYGVKREAHTVSSYISSVKAQKRKTYHNKISNAIQGNAAGIQVVKNTKNYYQSKSKVVVSKKNEEQIIDSFIFICLTGIRFSDYSKISKKNFTQIDGHWYINFQQAKTKKEVSVPIVYKKACDLLIKYEFELPKYTNAYFNRRLKKVFTLYKLFSEKVIIHKENMNDIFVKRDLITVHTGRRTFATNLFLKNTPINLIMAATGHETEKAFRTYIKASEIEKSKGLVNFADY